jgi:hypothetical protein
VSTCEQDKTFQKRKETTRHNIIKLFCHYLRQFMRNLRQFIRNLRHFMRNLCKYLRKFVTPDYRLNLHQNIFYRLDQCNSKLLRSNMANNSELVCLKEGSYHISPMI